MVISDLAVKRPVFASVISLLLLAFGLISFERLPLREYPEIDPPIVSISTVYPGAAASVVETRITEVIEDRVAGIEGIRAITSRSSDGRSLIGIEFNVGRDVDAAANDVRDRVAGLLNNLPEEADPPDITKAGSHEEAILWLDLESDRHTVLELTDYADRFLSDRFSALDGVARVRLGGGLNYAMRIWLDRNALAARSLTVGEVEAALRADNVELPAGSIESHERQFTVRVERSFLSAEDFGELVLGRSDDGYLVRLRDVARVELGAVEDRTFFRGNGVPMVGIGIIQQSQANTLAVAEAARNEAARLSSSLPAGMELRESYDSSVFVQGAIDEVYKTLFIAIGLVVLVIYLFLGSVRAMLVPAVAVPVSLMATFISLYALGFSINLLTLLALVLAIGLVVDDAIVVLENIHRRIERGESPLVAAFRGTRQVGFAVIATTLVLIAVFVPLAFLEGEIGRLFSEFALTMAAAVAFSSLVALTLSPMLASKLLKAGESRRTLIARCLERSFAAVERGYGRALAGVLRRPLAVGVFFLLVLSGAAWLQREIPTEFAPQEDRGAFFLLVSGPEGASFDYMTEYLDEIERRLMRLTETGEVTRLRIRAPQALGNVESFNSGIVILVLNDWAERRSGWEIMEDVRSLTAGLPGVLAFPVMRQGLGGGVEVPVQFVIGGGTYDELAAWRDTLLARLAEDNPGLVGLNFDYKETNPQLSIKVDRNRAGDLGVTFVDIGRTLETMLGSRRVTTFIAAGEEYDVILEGERDVQRTPTDIENIFVRSTRSDELIPLSNLVTLEAYADSSTLHRYNRVRAITLTANLAPNYSLGEALAHLEGLVSTHLPETAVIDYKGQSLDFIIGSGSLLFVFLLGIAVVFLVLAAQFENFVHPLVIMLTVPLAMIGALLGLYFTSGSLNIYSQFGLIMLVGLATKNGILIVEFVNQRRDEGLPFERAVMEASVVRLRPIVMTAITTAAGAVPLILAFGAGAETRSVIGIVVFSGVLTATLFTLFVVPVAYSVFARRTGAPGDVAERLEAELKPRSLRPALDTSDDRRAAE